jgi:hypothetical protein
MVSVGLAIPEEKCVRSLEPIEAPSIGGADRFRVSVKALECYVDSECMEVKGIIWDRAKTDSDPIVLNGRVGEMVFVRARKR